MQDERAEHAATPTDSSPTTDRRRADRVKVETAVGFITESNFYTGFSQDISEGGLFIATYGLQKLGTKVEVKFSIGDDEIEATGQVRWLREPRNSDVPPGMGIQFDGLDPKDREIIRQFVEVRDTLFYEG